MTQKPFLHLEREGQIFWLRGKTVFFLKPHVISLWKNLLIRNRLPATEMKSLQVMNFPTFPSHKNHNL